MMWIDSSPEHWSWVTLTLQSTFASHRSGLPMRSSWRFEVDPSCFNPPKRRTLQRGPPLFLSYACSNPSSRKTWRISSKMPILASGRSSLSFCALLPKTANSTTSRINWVSGCSIDGNCSPPPTARRTSLPRKRRERMQLCVSSQRESWKRS